MDILKKAAVAYKALIGREYEIIFSSGEAVRIIFKPANFQHLAGLHKLTDLYYISSPEYKPVKLFKMALEGKFTYEDLNCSVYFDGSARERIECLCRISELLAVGEKAVYKFDKNICRARVSFKADTIFFKDDGAEFFITFGAAQDKSGNYHYPETIFYRFDRAYISGQRIVSITEVRKIYHGKREQK